MRYSHWIVPSAPKLPVVALPDESPRPASATPIMPSLSHGWMANPFRSKHQSTTRPTPIVPAPDVSSSYEHARSRSYSNAGSRVTVTSTYDPTIYDNARRVSPAPLPSYTSSRPQHPDRARSMTPAPRLVSILKTSSSSSRTRSHSLSSSSEAPRQTISAVPTRPEPRRSNLGGISQTTTVHRTAPLKAEAISLGWPLVQYATRKRSRNAGPILYLDIGFDPRQPRNLRDNRTGGLWPLPNSDRNMSASTHCTLKKMVIECPYIGQITVRRSAGIRCIDIFAAIYDAYHERLGSNEQPDDLSRYRRTFKQRCMDSPDPAAELQAGMRQVDLLRGERIFDGLTRSGADWKLALDRP